MSQNLSKRVLRSNYTLTRDVEGYILQQDGVLEEDMPWRLPAGTLVTVYETDYNYIIERNSNFLPGLKTNVRFKAVISKTQE